MPHLNQRIYLLYISLGGNYANNMQTYYSSFKRKLPIYIFAAFLTIGTPTIDLYISLGGNYANNMQTYHSSFKRKLPIYIFAAFLTICTPTIDQMGLKKVQGLNMLQALATQQKRKVSWALS